MDYFPLASETCEKFNKLVYEKRMELSIETFLIEANERQDMFKMFS